VLGALAHGLPSVLLPMGADQPLNARRCEQLGVARVLDALRSTPADIRAAAQVVLADPASRQAAQAMQREIADMPDVTAVVPALERLAGRG
jgi:UDP:flavonoid glycosyltransferase YjiC (YdhE family)